MLTIEKLYKVNSVVENGDEITFDISVQANHKVFGGHFPGNPIMPGVAMLEIVKRVLSTHKQNLLQWKSISNCKFLEILNPNQYPRISLCVNISLKEDSFWSVNAVFKNSDVTFCKISGIVG